MYRAVLEDSGIHDASCGLNAPNDGTGWRAVWDATLHEMVEVEAPVSAGHLLNVMMAPPFGLREGTASLLLTALIVVESANLAVYEHGTFTPRISAPLVERLVRNPQNLALKHLGTSRRGRRWEVVKAIHEALDRHGLSERPESLTVLSTVQRLVSIYRTAHSSYAAKTRAFHGSERVDAGDAELAAAVRDALTEAREPDVLLFQALPDAVGLPRVQAGANSLANGQVDELAARVAAAVGLVAAANERLALAAFDRITLAAVPLSAHGKRLDREARLRALEGAAAAVATVHTVPQNVRSFIQACLMNAASPAELGSQVATTVTGVSPRDWDDHVAPRHLAELEDTAKAFRRIAELARARASYEDGDRSFQAYAVTMTAADGRTVDRTVALTAEERDDVTVAIHNALGTLSHLGERALEAVLAAVTAKAMGDEDVVGITDDHEANGGDAAHG